MHVDTVFLKRLSSSSWRLPPDAFTSWASPPTRPAHGSLNSPAICSWISATGPTTTIVQVDQVVEAGTLDPEAVVTPSIYVDRLVQVAVRHYTVQEAR
ncbi:hypothetical protein ACWEWX_15740 [Streptomyces asiaticus]